MSITMAVSESEAGSPLSEMGSDALSDLGEGYKRRQSYSDGSMSDHDSDDNTSVAASINTGAPRLFHDRPPKRRRVGASAYDHPTPQSSTLNIPRSPSGSISSDSSSDLPFDPSFANLPLTHPLSATYHAAQKDSNDPDGDHQIVTCLWDDCPTPEQDNLDKLVQHISNVHVVPKNKKFWCGWKDCTRKDIPHTSAYALRAHLRSHTKEKPFMCQVPECDRSFTRSDALAKHMRTVHETETLRDLDMKLKHGIDYAAKGTNGATTTSNIASGGGAKKIKLILKNGKTTQVTNGDASAEPKLEAALPALPTVASHRNIDAMTLRKEEQADLDLMGAVHMDEVSFSTPPDPSYWPPEIYAGMDEYERSLPPSQYFRLLRRQIRWATDEGEKIKAELRELSTRTDDRGGRVVHKDWSEDVEDIVRKQEWGVVDQLLNQILEGELKNQGHDHIDYESTDHTNDDDLMRRKHLWWRVRAARTVQSDDHTPSDNSNDSKIQ